MTKINLQGNPIETIGELPAIDTMAPDFCLVNADLADITLEEYKGKTIILNIFPSLDTPVCATSVRRFNKMVSDLNNTVVLCISADLPFAHKRFCEAEGLENVISASVFRSGDFGKDYGVTITTGPLAGLLSRAVVVINSDGRVAYTEQVSDIVDDPDFDAAVKVIESL